MNNEGRAEVARGAQGFRVSWDVNTCAEPRVAKKGLIVSCNQIDLVSWGALFREVFGSSGWRCAGILRKPGTVPKTRTQTTSFCSQVTINSSNEQN